MKIPKEELVAILSQFNPWWKRERIADLPEWRRAAFQELMQWIKAPPAGTFTGDIDPKEIYENPRFPFLLLDRIIENEHYELIYFTIS